MGARRRVTWVVLLVALAGCQPSQPAPTVSAARSGDPSAAASPQSATPAPTPTVTPAPPAETAFSAPADRSKSGHLRLSTTLSSNGVPLGGAPITVAITALDDTYQVIKLKDIVPVQTKDALVGFRFNEEGAGPATVRMNVYRITYTDGESSKNRVINPAFASGLYSWDRWGSGSATVRDSDRGDGRMLRLRADSDENIGINNRLRRFTPGSDFVLTVRAMLPPAGSVSGYASVFFLWGKNLVEGHRITLPLVAKPIPQVELVTDASGAIALDIELPEGTYAARISYAGDASHTSAGVDHEVAVP